MRIGILTFHNAINCGAMLQAWALCAFLRKLNHSVSFPDCNRVGMPRFLRPWITRSGLRYVVDYMRAIRSRVFSLGVEDFKRYRFSEFKNKYLPIKEVKPIDFASNYDLMIAGSDQVWNPEFAEWWLDLFLGERVPSEVPMVGYAISIGDGLPEDRFKDRYLKAMKRFLAVSFRENRVVKYFSELSQEKAWNTVDPTLLMRRDDYREIEYPRRIVEGDYLFAYCVSYNKELGLKLRTIADSLGVKLVLVDAYRSFINDRWETRTEWAVSPDRFLAYMRDAKYVVSLSFHGTVFALMYGKQYISFCKSGSISRVKELLDKIGEVDRAVPSSLSAELCACLLRKPRDASKVADCLSELSKESVQFIEMAVNRAKHT